MRGKLFVPGSWPELFAKAMASEADGLSFDLEDAVDESMKDAARRSSRASCARAGPRQDLIVRVNGLETPHFEADIRAIGLQAGWGDLIEPLDIDRYNPCR